MHFKLCQCGADSTSFRASSSSSRPLAVGSHSTTSTKSTRTSPILDLNPIQPWFSDVSSSQCSRVWSQLHAKRNRSNLQTRHTAKDTQYPSKQQIRLTPAGCKSTAWRHFTTKDRSIINHTLCIQVLSSSYRSKAFPHSISNPMLSNVTTMSHRRRWIVASALTLQPRGYSAGNRSFSSLIKYSRPFIV